MDGIDAQYEFSNTYITQMGTQHRTRGDGGHDAALGGWQMTRPKPRDKGAAEVDGDEGQDIIGLWP